MKIADSFNFSLNNILHRQLRSWLTLLGIIIGVTAVVSIISIGDGASASINAQLTDFGTDTITIYPGFSSASKFGGGFKGHSKDLSGSTTATSTENPELGRLDVVIIKGNPNVELVNEIVSGGGEFVFLSESINVSVKGVNPVSWLEINSDSELEAGRFLGASDSYSIVIGGQLANDTFKQPITVGRRITIEDKAFTVIGILEDSSKTILMPYDIAWVITDVEKNTYSSIEAKLKDNGLMAETADEIEEALMISRKVTETDKDFTVSTPLELLEMVNETVGTMTLFLGAIAAVSLIVGAVGVANSMFTSVLEKTKEIGIMKALGATSNEIMVLFIIESGLFGLVGGLIGVLLGLGTSALLSMALGMQTLVSIELMALAIGLSTLIGVISGLLPARSASKLRPIEALRYE